MYYNGIDGHIYKSKSDFPDYGNWTVIESKENNVNTYANDSDITKLPTNVSKGSSAVSTDGTAYSFDGEKWVSLG